MQTVQRQNGVIQQSIFSKRRFPHQRSTIGVIAEYSRSRHCKSLLGRAIPCSNVAQQRQKIIRNRVALVGEESVSGGYRRRRRRLNQENPPMRIYIIGNDGITLCREAPATVSEAEIAVGSKEELHAAPLSGKRLLALWNAVPGVEKRKKVGDRDALIDQLWSAIEMLPEPEPPSNAKRPSKQDDVIAMLRRPEGATVDEVASVTGWQRHTVRGVFSGTLKKKLGLTLASAKEERGRVYRIAEPASA
jgi:hypothetical protein